MDEKFEYNFLKRTKMEGLDEDEGIRDRFIYRGVVGSENTTC